MNKAATLNMTKELYIKYLDEIFSNARNLNVAAVLLLKESLKNPKLRPYAQFMLYSCVEECGKFLIILDQFPSELTSELLYRIGFYDHYKKIERLASNIQKYKSGIERDNKKVAEVLRKNLREPSIYVDLQNNKIIPPKFVENKIALDSLTSLVVNCIKFCELRLKEFKETDSN